MNRDQLERLLRGLSETEPAEISCTECFDLLSTVVDLELSGGGETPLSIRLAHHLSHCAVCREEYEVLRDFVHEESPPDEAR